MAKRKTNDFRPIGAAMVGVTAVTLATGGVQVAGAATGPPRTTTTAGTIYACYKNTTKALSETTKAKGCQSGFTKLSWNAKGPQGPVGPQGPAGPQGPPGANPGFFNYNSSFRLIPHSVSTVVASLQPTSAGDWAVTGLADLGLHPNVWGSCWLDEVSVNGHAFSATPHARDWVNSVSRTVPFTTTGDVFTTHVSSTIREVCLALHGPASDQNVAQAAITATRVSAITGGAMRRPEHKFTRPSSTKPSG